MFSFNVHFIIIQNDNNALDTQYAVSLICTVLYTHTHTQRCVRLSLCGRLKTIQTVKKSIQCAQCHIDVLTDRATRTYTNYSTYMDVCMRIEFMLLVLPHTIQIYINLLVVVVAVVVVGIVAIAAVVVLAVVCVRIEYLISILR